MINFILSFFILLLLSACSQTKFTIVNLSSLTYDGKILQNISYGDDARQKLDVYIPKTSEKLLPVIVFFHGGRWTFGSKEQYKFAAISLSKKGYIVVVPNTRQYPKIKFPVFIEDGAKAISWVNTNIVKFGANKKLYISGHSSGAHIGALITADETYLKKENLKTNIITAFAGISGPYDFEPNEPDLIDIFGPSTNFINMKVTSFIDGNEPPMMLLYTSKDKVVGVRNLNLLKKAINDSDGKVETKIYENGNHVDSIAALSWINPANLPVSKDIDEFFKQY